MLYALTWHSETAGGSSGFTLPTLPVPPQPFPDADFHFLAEPLFLLRRDFQFSLHGMTAAKALKEGEEISSL